MRVRVVGAALVAATLAACSGSRLRCGSCAPTPPCAAAPAPCAPVTSPCRPPPDVACGCGASFFDGYVPIVPVNETRVAFTALIMPPTPFLGTEGEADTPRRGRVGFNVSRIDDERVFRDDLGTQFELDGEMQVATLEWVSPRQSLNLGCGCVPYHVGFSLSAYTAHPALFDGLRNFTEEYIVGRDAGIEAAHQTGGQEISATTALGDRTEFLDSTPLWKAKGVLKVPLPDFDVHGRPGRWAASLGITAPAFGSHSESGNDHVVPELVIAASVPLSERWRLTGAASLTVPGPSSNFEDLGIDHRPLVAGGMVNVEWWVTPCFAVALGLSINGPYTRDSGLPTDLFSFYTNLGVLYRLSERTEVHLMFSENPGTGIVTDGDPSSDYTLNTQRDADFTLTLGATFAF